MSAPRSSFRAPLMLTAAAVITSLAAVGPASAQTKAFTSPPAPTTARAASSTEDARRLSGEGRLKEARKSYERAARDARAQGEYGREALDGLANIQFALDDIKGAARTLDELGERASAFGDPETEITAFYKSALLFAQAGDRKSAALRVPRLKTLIQSPVLSGATRQIVAERIAR